MAGPTEPSTPPALEPGTLWARVRKRTAHALSTGTLSPIETRAETVPEAGIPFSIRIVSSLRTKDEARRRAPRGGNPFLPPEPDLLVGELTATHRAVLNRFPVLAHHLLIVTREAEPQGRALDGADFDAAARCLREMDGLVFYNSGPEAGASQEHRHLQLVPFPVGDGPEPTPIEHALEPVLRDPGRSTVPAYGFVHAAAPLPAGAWRREGPEAAEAMALAYRALAGATGLRLGGSEVGNPYNLLITRRWMLLVLRRRERFEGVSVNALGFAGSLLVKDEAGLETVRRHGPLAVLRNVTVGAVETEKAAP